MYNISNPEKLKSCVACGTVFSGTSQQTACSELCRFWPKVLKKDKSSCWPFVGSVNERGYGLFKRNGKTDRAHRTAFALAYKIEPPPNLVVGHACDNPICCNPDHLWLGSGRANVIDRNRKNRTAKGEKLTFSKLTENDVLDIRSSSEPSYALASELGVSTSAVAHVRTRRTWGHVKETDHG